MVTASTGKAQVLVPDAVKEEIHRVVVLDRVNKSWLVVKAQ